MKDLTILVNSCDLYETAWEPFFKLFLLQWPSCPYDFILNTETKEYKGSIKNVKTINTPNAKTWTERLRKVLEQIDSEYIFFMLEDYFVLDKINDRVFFRAVELMNENKNIGMAALIHTDKENVDEGSIVDSDFFSRKKDKSCFIWCVPAIWRRKYLLSILRDHESIW